MLKYLLVISMLLVVGCEGPVGPQGEKGEKGDDGESYIIQPTEQIYITRKSGNNQTGNVRTKLTNKFQVLVTNGFGQPLDDIRVDWDIIEGEGSLSYESDITSPNGEMSHSHYLTFGDTAGEVKVKATVFASGESVVFSATAK